MKYRGIVPADLPRHAPRWKSWPLDRRIADALMIGGYTTAQRQTAVAITMNEQPHKVPNGNCCGLMCWKEHRPWGWPGWGQNPPTGYALIPEGQGDKMGVFLSFSHPRDSLRRLLVSVKSKPINDAEDYAARWVGVSGGADQVNGFNRNLAKVLEAWPGSAQSTAVPKVPGWQDAGASRP